jgi:hypothetical protein
MYTTRWRITKVHFFSLSFAGEKWGGSAVVPPWLDPSRGLEWQTRSLGQEEGVLTLRLDPAEAGGAAEAAVRTRAEFGFRADAFFPPPAAAVRSTMIADLDAGVHSASRRISRVADLDADAPSSRRISRVADLDAGTADNDDGSHIFGSAVGTAGPVPSSSTAGGTLVL